MHVVAYWWRSSCFELVPTFNIPATQSTCYEEMLTTDYTIYLTMKKCSWLPDLWTWRSLTQWHPFFSINIRMTLMHRQSSCKFLWGLCVSGFLCTMMLLQLTKLCFSLCFRSVLGWKFGWIWGCVNKPLQPCLFRWCDIISDLTAKWQFELLPII